MSIPAHYGDVGTVIRMTVKDQDDNIVDLSSYVSMYLYIKKPQTSSTVAPEVVTKVCSLYTDGTDGILQYTIVSGDFSTPGVYEFQAKVTLSSGAWYTTTSTWRIERNLV